MLGKLLPKRVVTQVFVGMLDSAAAEHAARMTAMDAATRNAGEVLDKLTLYLNRVRQASITTEQISRSYRVPWPKSSGIPKARGKETMKVVGKVIQVAGPAVDVQFSARPSPEDLQRRQGDQRGVRRSGTEIDVTCEVQQYLGEGRVRTVAMQPTEGMIRGMKVSDTGKAISVPVGPQVLGRVLNVLSASPSTSAARLKPRLSFRFTATLRPWPTSRRRRKSWRQGSRSWT